MMARLRINKTNFTAGEVAPPLLGRRDIAAYENGAAKLRNVFVSPTGCVARRSGLRYIDTLSTSGRLASFEFNTEQVYLLVFVDRVLHIYKDSTRQTTIITPWTSEQLWQLNWTQSADTLLVVHPDIPPQRITRSSDVNWKITNWSFASADNGRIYIPHHLFHENDVQVTRNGDSGTIMLTATAFVFHPDHMDCRFRFSNKEVVVVDVAGAGGNTENGWYDKATISVVESLTDTPTTTREWSEQAYSIVRGWPTSVTFHQDRLVIGGSRSLPNSLWFSKSSDLLNFDQGTGLDDESIEFSILSDQVNAIRGLFSGRHLQVFTSGAEWMVTGDPLTPTNIQLHRQTRVGSPVDRIVSPRDIDGATVFVPRNDKQLREFVFTDVEQAYQSSDLALLSEHLVNRPIDMDYDPNTRLLYVVMSDGSIATLTVYRAEQVTAWTAQETAGHFLSVAVVGSQVFTIVKRGDNYFIEVFDSELQVDSALSGSNENPASTWDGLSHLEGTTVSILADGAVRNQAVVIDGQVTLDEPAYKLQAGLPYSHIIKPLPPQLSVSGNGAQGGKIRPVSITFRFDNTYALRLDLGRGPVDVPFRRLGIDTLDTSPLPFTGEKKVRTMGWQHDGASAAWKIEQDTPLPFNLLSVATEISVNG